MNEDSLRFALEVINGAWAILSLWLGMVCGAYLLHEIRVHKTLIRWRWTIGMRVAVAILAISTGEFITRSAVFVWRHFHGYGPFNSVESTALLIGAGLGAAGFACAIRELSEPLFGKAPWIVATIAVFLFIGAELF